MKRFVALSAAAAITIAAIAVTTESVAARVWVQIGPTFPPVVLHWRPGIGLPAVRVADWPLRIPGKTGVPTDPHVAQTAPHMEHVALNQ